MASPNNSLSATHCALGMCEAFHTQGDTWCLVRCVEGSRVLREKWPMVIAFQVTAEMGENYE